MRKRTKFQNLIAVLITKNVITRGCGPLTSVVCVNEKSETRIISWSKIICCKSYISTDLIKSNSDACLEISKEMRIYKQIRKQVSYRMRKQCRYFVTWRCKFTLRVISTTLFNVANST